MGDILVVDMKLQTDRFYAVLHQTARDLLIVESNSSFQVPHI